MTVLHLILLALLQGITEFLPISSSGHLLLFHYFVDGAAEDLALLMDISVHVGTLFAVLLYFWRDIWVMLQGLPAFLTGRFENQGAKMIYHLVLASIPVIIAGFALHAIDPYFLRSPYVVAVATLGFGIVLWVADARFPSDKSLEDMGAKGALLIGLAQILALIPGTSRSGITMSAARMLGYSRSEAARFSLLLSIIAISGAGVLGARDVAGSSLLQAHIFDLALVAALAFLSALGAIVLMMRWLTKQSFRVFALYRIVLGGALLAALFSGVIA